jgi:hypothetical protein
MFAAGAAGRTGSTVAGAPRPRNKIKLARRGRFSAGKYAHIDESGASRCGEKLMFRSTQLRFATIVLMFAVAAVSLTAASAWAFSQGNGGTGEDSNSAFADPDDQINIFGHKGEAQAFGSNGAVQFDPQRSQLTPFKHFQSNGLTSPPDPLSRPSN